MRWLLVLAFAMPSIAQADCPRFPRFDDERPSTFTLCPIRVEQVEVGTICMAMRCTNARAARWYFAESAAVVDAAWEKALRADGWRVRRWRDQPLELYADRKKDQLRHDFVIADGTSGSAISPTSNR